MKKIYLLLALIITVSTLHAQLYATTSDGRRVVLHNNGGWRFIDSGYNTSSANLTATYNEAYNYAYDIIYADEFFSADRKTKATQWAVQSIKDIAIPIGSKTLDQWFDELNTFAYDYMFKSEFFANDRRNKASEWAAQTIKERSYYEDYRVSYITRHRQAYDFAYNRIFRNEFFSQDRRKKSVDWANAFVKR